MTPGITDLLLLPALLLVCAASSFSDLKDGKIYNRVLAAGAAWGAAVYAFLSLSRFYAPHLTEGLVQNNLFGGSWPLFLLHAAANASLSLLFGFLLFHFELWSAGDAKLFFVAALLLPFNYYFRHYLPFFPSFNIFLNTIIASAAYVWAETAWKLARYAAANSEKHVWKEIVGASLARLKGALVVLLAAGLVFSLLMCLAHLKGFPRGVSNALVLAAMVALLYFADDLSEAAESGRFRAALAAVSALFFLALALSSLRLQFLRMALTMLATFAGLYLVAGVMPALAQKYSLSVEDMPFATWLSLGVLLTVLIRGSMLYLVFGL